MSVQAWQVLAFAAGMGTSAVLLAMLKKAGVDPLLSLYQSRARYWGRRVAELQQALIREIEDGSQEAELIIEADLNAAIERFTHWGRMVEVRLG